MFYPHGVVKIVLLGVPHQKSAYHCATQQDHNFHDSLHEVPETAVAGMALLDLVPQDLGLICQLFLTRATWHLEKL